MWHVKFDRVVGTISWSEEYAAGIIGKGRAIHAIDRFGQGLCGVGRGKHDGAKAPHEDNAQVTCIRCLRLLDRIRYNPHTQNWKEAN